MDPKKTLTWFFSLPSVRYAQIFIVMAFDLLTLSNLYPKHSSYIARPFLLWQDNQ
ncbi:GM21063 [Drosophila sechellia]|uniref:GM21063 n=2 Tax=Drosophila sechellia TaxID=7238 RepID=B4HS92_DROSE|nr:GM21063 [Drosophila sechellia]